MWLLMTLASCHLRLRTLILAVAFAVLRYTMASAQVWPGEIACIPQRPIVHPGEDVDVTAFVPTATGSHLQFAWKATGGQISGAGKEVKWSFRDAMSGIYTSTVTVTNAGEKLGECAVQVTVVEAERGVPDSTGPVPRTTARAFLSTAAKEEAGYGLYSYLLFGSPPTDSARPRYLKAIQAYLALIPTVADLLQYRSANKLNITYVPVKVRPTDMPTAEWVLANYDYPRARVLLDLLSSRHQTGPYIVSTLTPLSTLQALPHDHLFQDLSLVPTQPDDLLSWWIRAFLNQAAQEQFWKQQTGELLALKVRTMISVEAAALPEVQKQLASWIAWAK